MNSEQFTQIAQKIAAYEPEMIDLQTKITAIPALGPENGGEGEIKRAEFLKKILAALKPDELLEIKAPDDRVPAGYRPNLIALFNGKRPTKTIWIMSHMDIVPPGELSRWNTDPYQVSVRDGKLYGRGVEDNQQGLVGSIFAIKALRDLGIIPEFNVGLAIVADEETGSRKGLGYVLEERADLFRQDDLIIVPDAGNETGTMIEVAEKSILWLKFRIMGKQCHASTPEAGINAHRAGAHLIVRLDSLYQTFNLKNPVFDPPFSTFEPTKKESNVPNINTIPGEDIFYLDCRVLPEYSLDQIDAEISRMIREIEQAYQVRIEMTSPQKEAAAPSTPTDAPVVKALEAAIRTVYQRNAATVGIGGGTVAALFRRAGLNAAVWSTLDELAHQPNEYCVISNLINDTKVFAHIFIQD